MPAKSVAQREAMAIAEHKPGMLYGRNKSLLKMSKEELHKYASTKEKGLPRKKERGIKRQRKVIRRTMQRGR